MNTEQHYTDTCADVSLLDIIKNGGSNRIFEEHNKLNLIYNPFNEYISQLGMPSFFLIVPGIALILKSEIKKFLKSFYLHEIFELGNCYLGHYEEPYFLWFVSKEPAKRIKISVFYGDAHLEKDTQPQKDSGLKLPSCYTDAFMEYISLLDEWHKGLSKMPESKEYKYEFNEISPGEFEPARASARYYRKKNNDIRRMLSKTTVVPLQEVADIIESKWSCDLQADEIIPTRVIHASKTPSYPFDFEKHTTFWPFSRKMLEKKEKLRKNDIVLYKRPLDCFLLNDEPKDDLYCVGTIIRAKTVTPEYLFLYLMSDIAKRIWEELQISAGIFGSASLTGSSTYPFDIPVILPQEPDEYYFERFKEFSTPDEHHYLKRIKLPMETLEDVFNRETQEIIRFNNTTLVKKQVLEDIEELNTCFSNKAYKATLILCGSILEAVLIDWLSEIDGVDYFHKEITVKKVEKKNGCPVKDEKGEPVIKDVPTSDLKDYIEKIKEIKEPEWTKEAEYAHAIRKKRNLVHAKLCMKQNVRIDESICKQVIEYLKEVLSSRGIL